MRRTILKQNGFVEIDDWLDHVRMGTGAKCDDVVDACAAAIAACSPIGSVPEGSPPMDMHGLPIQIWF